MDYIQEYRKFVNSYNFAYAIRVTLAVTLPAIIFGYFGQLDIGFVASLGAMTVSNADIPGPVQRRFNGMTATLVLNFLIAIIVGLCNNHVVLLGVLIAVLCFVLSIVSVYGSRVSTIGFAGLIIMVLVLDTHRTPMQVFINSLYLLAGGVWYMLLALALFRIRPYRIIQQALGESIFFIGDYLKSRSYFYNEDVDYERTYKNLMQQEQVIHEKQELLREMIFKSRSITRQSTTTSRTLLIIFIDSIDLFEKATGTIYNYESMHRRFDGTDILKHFQQMILKMSVELHEIGVAVQSGRPSHASPNLNDSLHELKQHFEKFIDEHRSPENITSLISMRKIMQSIEDITLRIYTLHHYTLYDKKKIKEKKLTQDYGSFVEPTNLNLQLLLQNLSLRSNNFRHALRVSIATTVGYIVAHMLQLGHSYWVLLTILVILKPSYSLTKQRNYNRLLGTIIGAVAGVGLLFLIRNEQGLLAAMIILMLITYSFIRTRYFIGVIFMTAYLIIFFFLIDTKNFVDVFENRIIDTALGSVIALLATYILVPSWEKHQVKNYMTDALEKASAYFKTVAEAFSKGTINEFDYRLSRKQSFVAQANLSGGFTRMMNEPKNKQEKVAQLHQFTVLISTLNSHIVSLADYAQKFAKKYQSPYFEPITQDIILELAEARNNILKTDDISLKEINLPASTLKEEMKELVEKRRHEMQQGLIDTETRTMLNEYKPIVDQFVFISRIAGDIKKNI